MIKKSRDGVLLTWNSHNNDGDSNNQDVNELLALLRRADVGMIREVSHETEQKNKE